MGGIPCGSPIKTGKDGAEVAVLDTVVRSVIFPDGMEISLEHIARYQRCAPTTV
jgi:hypothetical protein